MMEQADAADRKQVRGVFHRYAKLAPACDTRWELYSRNSLGKLAEHLRLEGGEHMLDLACGTGRLAALLCYMHPALRVTGVDISPELLRAAPLRLPEDERTAWHLGTLETVQLEPGTFDLVTCNSAFHGSELPPPYEMLRRIGNHNPETGKSHAASAPHLTHEVGRVASAAVSPCFQTT